MTAVVDKHLQSHIRHLLWDRRCPVPAGNLHRRGVTRFKKPARRPEELSASRGAGGLPLGRDGRSDPSQVVVTRCAMVQQTIMVRHGKAEKQARIAGAPRSPARVRPLGLCPLGGRPQLFSSSARAAAVQHQHGRAGAELGEVDLPVADLDGAEGRSEFHRSHGSVRSWWTHKPDLLSGRCLD